MAIQVNFKKMQKECNSFYRDIDVNEDDQLVNVFWVDPKSGASYKDFRDVVMFNTTQLTNKYGMRFAPFVGINHHGQSNLLECGLISYEDTKTFIWLFSIVSILHVELSSQQNHYNLR